MKILLASNSPRRKELLQSLGYAFEVVKIDCEEIYPKNLPTEKIAEYLSELKSNAYPELHNGEVLITADTIVALGNEVMGKPKNKSEALEMLTKLSGKTHEVYSGITVRSSEKTFTATDVAHVEFDLISPEEAHYYIENFHPFDKAGGYGIQEWIGMAKTKRIDGSFYTIMGLPSHLLYSVLKDFV